MGTKWALFKKKPVSPTGGSELGKARPGTNMEAQTNVAAGTAPSLAATPTIQIDLAARIHACGSWQVIDSS